MIPVRIEWLRHFVQAVLVILFCLAVGNGVYNWYMKYTNTVISYQGTAIPFPSMTICPAMEVTSDKTFAAGQNQTLVDFYDNMEWFSSKIIEATVYNGNNYKEEFSADLWKDDGKALTDFAIPSYYEDEPHFRLDFCTTVSVEKTTFSPKNAMSVRVVLNMSAPLMVAVERHGLGMSTMNYFWNEEQVTRLKEYTDTSINFGVKRHVIISTPRQECHEEPIKFHDCLNDFIEFKLDCKLPWTKKKTDQRLCDKPEDLENFFEFYEDISMDESVLEEMNQGDFKCLIPNCETITWPILSVDDFTVPGLEVSTSAIQFYMPHGLKVQNINEVPAYGFFSFVADFGGYLGLLLGASLLSLFDELMEFLMYCSKRTNQKK